MIPSLQKKKFQKHSIVNKTLWFQKLISPIMRTCCVKCKKTWVVYFSVELIHKWHIGQIWSQGNIIQTPNFKSGQNLYLVNVCCQISATDLTLLDFLDWGARSSLKHITKNILLIGSLYWSKQTENKLSKGILIQNSEGNVQKFWKSHLKCIHIYTFARCDQIGFLSSVFPSKHYWILSNLKSIKLRKTGSKDIILYERKTR